MHHACIKTSVMALAVWCTASLLTLGALKTVQADDSPQSGEMVQEACRPYTEQECSACLPPSETSLSITASRVPKTPTEGRLWSAECSGVDLQVPETLMRALLTDETHGKIVDLQVPEA